MYLHVDYDDGFVAYLNGAEIARANMGNDPTPSYDALAINGREAIMITGGKPEAFVIDSLEKHLVEGENVLAIQVHNATETSSDMSLIPFLTAGQVNAGALPDSLEELLELTPTFYHTDFKISSKGETLYLFRPDGVIEDSLKFAFLLLNVSVGRLPDGESTLAYFQTPTPDSTNGGDQFLGIIDDEIAFSHSTGSYPAPISLTMSHANTANELRYTIDGV